MPSYSALYDTDDTETPMVDDEGKALVIRGSRSLAEVGAGARSILSGVVSDALTVARAREAELATARFRVGGYEFREPDYRQILIWAKALEIDPRDLVKQFEQTAISEELIYVYEARPSAFDVQEGAIVSLVWNAVALPIKSFDWVRGLSIREITILGEDNENVEGRNIEFTLPSLRKLCVFGINLRKLDLSGIPGLIVLHCCRTQLTELNLLRVTGLTELDCGKIG